MKASKDRELGVRLIVTYKLVRGSIALCAAIVLLIAAVTGEGKAIHELAHELHRHLTGVWSSKLAALVERASSPHSLTIGTIGLACDGTFTLFEGWAMRRGFRWAPWLVVIATGAFVPLEVYAIWRKTSFVRLFVLLVNVAVVYYLVRRKLAPAVVERFSHPPHPHPPRSSRPSGPLR